MPPSFLPLALAAASAALVRAEIISVFLGDYRHQTDSEPVGIRHIGRHELHPGLFQAKQEMGVTREPVELSDNQHATREAAGVERAGTLD